MFVLDYIMGSYQWVYELGPTRSAKGYWMVLGSPTSGNGLSSNIQVGSCDARVPQPGSSRVPAMVDQERVFPTGWVV